MVLYKIATPAQSQTECYIESRSALAVFTGYAIRTVFGDGKWKMAEQCHISNGEIGLFLGTSLVHRYGADELLFCLLIGDKTMNINPKHLREVSSWDDL